MGFTGCQSKLTLIPRLPHYSTIVFMTLPQYTSVDTFSSKLILFGLCCPLLCGMHQITIIPSSSLAQLLGILCPFLFRSYVWSKHSSGLKAHFCDQLKSFIRSSVSCLHPSTFFFVIRLLPCLFLCCWLFNVSCTVRWVYLCREQCAVQTHYFC